MGGEGAVGEVPVIAELDAGHARQRADRHQDQVGLRWPNSVQPQSYYRNHGERRRDDDKRRKDALARHVLRPVTCRCTSTSSSRPYSPRHSPRRILPLVVRGIPPRWTNITASGGIPCSAATAPTMRSATSSHASTASRPIS